MPILFEFMGKRFLHFHGKSSRIPLYVERKGSFLHLQREIRFGEKEKNVKLSRSGVSIEKYRVFALRCNEGHFFD